MTTTDKPHTDSWIYVRPDGTIRVCNTRAFAAALADRFGGYFYCDLRG